MMKMNENNTTADHACMSPWIGIWWWRMKITLLLIMPVCCHELVEC